MGWGKRDALVRQIFSLLLPRLVSGELDEGEMEIGVNGVNAVNEYENE